MTRLKPSVCIDSVFEGQSFRHACKTVRQAGISAIEFWGWWDKDLDALQEAQQENDLVISACCTKFISLVNPADRSAYIDGVAASIEAAHRLGTDILISQVGDVREDVPRAAQHDSLVEGLREVAPLLEQAKITLVIEPLNERVNHPGYYLVRSDEAFQIIDEVNSDFIKVVFDIYHQQISEGDLIENICANIDKIGHFHAAGNPGRHELQHGEIAYPYVFDQIRATGFTGYVGLEYWPLEKEAILALREVSGWFVE
tara:strand:- start:13 stop:783 length:771 start_codon:yes stop_codon:yes gene_type:complete